MHFAYFTYNAITETYTDDLQCDLTRHSQIKHEKLPLQTEPNLGVRKP